MSAHVNLLKTSTDVRRTMNVNVGGEGSLFKFSFSGSHSYKKMQHTITNSSRYVEDVSAFESATRVDFVPDWVLQLDRLAQMFVDRFLTGTFESNRAGYQRFINQFGTHYFATANFGGYIRTYMETTKSYVYSKSDREVKNNAKASFLKIISLHGGTVSGSTTVSETFRRATSSSVRYYGGDTNLLMADGIQHWQPSVDNDPWLFSGRLRPISDLISDPTKKSNLIKAVREHVLRAYLEELLRLLHAARQKVGNDGTLNTLESRLETMQTRTTLVESEVETLGNDVNYQLTVPSWFTEKTKLCYKWRPDGDGGQCGGGAARLLCSAPNARTAVYRDDTDGRGGGCRMQWGITSYNNPSWFNEVKICYRWYPDGDGGQCGGGASRLLCAPINRYTSEYRDDSDGRGGGCRMSWKLDVPSNSPLWLKTTQLCYYWYPDGNGGQCGPAPSRTLCARSDQWTAYYRDDTDGRSGGCRMSWGLSVQM